MLALDTAMGANTTAYHAPSDIKIDFQPLDRGSIPSGRPPTGAIPAPAYVWEAAFASHYDHHIMGGEDWGGSISSYSALQDAAAHAKTT